MPTMTYYSRKEKRWITWYKWPGQHKLGAITVEYDLLRQWRRQAIKEQEAWIALQKELGREHAQFCKVEAKHWLRMQRACAIHLGWLGDPDPNQKVEQNHIHWPPDLGQELDTVCHRLLMHVEGWGHCDPHA